MKIKPKAKPQQAGSAMTILPCQMAQEWNMGQFIASTSRPIASIKSTPRMKERRK
jgi:hypothetical protein